MASVAEIDDRIDKCQQILQVDPNSQIFAALAEAYRKKGDLEKAFRICQSGLKIHPSYGSAHVVMAKINMDRGLYDWAEAEVKKSIELEGNSRAIELLLAEIYIYKGEFASAVRLLKKLHQSDPRNDQIAKLLVIAEKLPGEQIAVTDSQRLTLARNRKPSGDAIVIESSTHAATEEPDLTVGQVLKQAITIPDVDGALFVTFEGLVVESQWSLTLDQATVAATLAEVVKFLNGELVRSRFGKVRALLIENGRQVFYVIRAADGLFLFVGNGRINLGTLRMRIGSLAETYTQRA